MVSCDFGQEGGSRHTKEFGRPRSVAVGEVKGLADENFGKTVRQ